MNIERRDEEDEEEEEGFLSKCVETIHDEEHATQRKTQINALNLSASISSFNTTTSWHFDKWEIGLPSPSLPSSSSSSRTYRRSLRFLLVSDTHNRHASHEMEEADVLIHAGDQTHGGTAKELDAFNKWLGTIKHKYRYIILIAGNHELVISASSSTEAKERFFSNATHYLVDETVELSFFEEDDQSEGSLKLKVFGSPFVPFKMAADNNTKTFNRSPSALHQKWERHIPDDVNIVVTHTPAFGAVDTGGLGCPSLRRRLDSLQHLAFHVCGHIHPGYGVARLELPPSPSPYSPSPLEGSNRSWTSVNAACLGSRRPILITLRC